MLGLEHPLKRHVRPSARRTAACPGCGNGIVAQSVLRAIEQAGKTLDDFVFCSGIGCAAWIPSPFFHADVLHTTHGRPIAFATGVKLALPDKKVMVISGDGDLTAIGGNHLVHAARRNIDMLVVCVNNGIYGMTGGQTAPTTPVGLRTTTSPYGNVEPSFDICRLAQAAGASFVARWTTFHPRQLTQTLKASLGKRGFSLIEVISQCPVQYGRRTGAGTAVQMLQQYKENSVSVRRAAGMSSQELAGKIVVGVLHDEPRPEFVEQMLRVRASALDSRQRPVG